MSKRKGSSGNRTLDDLLPDDSTELLSSAPSTGTCWNKVTISRGQRQMNKQCRGSLPSPLAVQFSLNSGVAGFSDARSEQWKWTPLTEITITDWINVLFVAIIWNLLSAENQFIFHLRHSFCRPLDSAARGGNTICPTLATPLFLNTSYTKPTINEKLVQANLHKS